MSNTTTKFAAHDDSVIYGTGDTAEAALADALQYGATGQFKTEPMTADLAAEVESRGGAISYTRRDGILDIVRDDE